MDRIQATAENRDLVEIVEQISADWMRIIEKIIIKGKVIRRNSTKTGPIDELEHWLQTHSMYSIAQELITTETFENHMKCLQISGSKLANVSVYFHLHSILKYFLFSLKFALFFRNHNQNIQQLEMEDDCR